MDHLGVALGTHEPIEDLLDFRKCQVEAHTGVRETQRTLHVAGPVDLDDSQAGVLLVGAQPTIVRTAVLEMARVRPAGSGPWLAAVLGRGSVNIEAGFSTLRQPSKLCALRLNRSHLTSLSGSPIEGRDAYALFVVLSLCLGIQNATARKLAVPDLTTTVLTLTSTGIAADSAIAGGEGSLLGRRFIAVFATLAGAFIGAAFVSFTARSSTR